MKPVINPLYPIEEIHSVEELMDIATGMEHEAAERYDHLAAEMARRREPELADLFRRLSVIEREHEAGLGRWATREGLRTPKPAHFSWPMPETFGAEAEGGDAHVLTAYRALSIAVRNEERAFAFYSYLAAMAPDAVVRTRAEALAREELNHVSQLRVLRRKAFHMERGVPRGVRRARDVEELDAMSRALDESAAAVDAAAAAALEAAGEEQGAFLLRRSAEAVWRRLDGAAVSGAWTAAAQGAQDAGLLEPGRLTAFGALRLALNDAEEALEAYMATAEHASEQALLERAQTLAEPAVARLATIRSLISVAEQQEEGR